MKQKQRLYHCKPVATFKVEWINNSHALHLLKMHLQTRKVNVLWGGMVSSDTHCSVLSLQISPQVNEINTKLCKCPYIF